MDMSELKKGAFKEVRFAGKIKQNDLQLKADMVKRLMEKGHQVKCTAIDPIDNMDLETLLSRFCAVIEDVAIAENKLQVEKKASIFFCRQARQVWPRKKSGKKASKAGESSSTMASMDSLFFSNKRRDRGSESEHEFDAKQISEEDAETEKSEWALFDRDDDADTVSDIMDEVNAESRELDESAVATGPIHLSALKKFSNTPADVPKHGVKNRYAARPKMSADINGESGRNLMNSVPKIPDLDRQIKFGMNSSPGIRKPQEAPPPSSVSSSSRNLSN